MEVRIRKALASEAGEVADIGRRTFYETWKDVNTEEDLQLYMNSSFNMEKIRKELEAGSVNIFLFAFADDELAGYVKLRNDRNYEQLGGLKSLEMERIYVLRRYHDKKVGKALMDESIRLAREGKYHWLWLGVNQENSRAIKFYEKVGFEVFGTKQFVLGTAIDEDFLMKLEIKNES